MCSLKDSTFSYNLPHNIKHACFLKDQKIIEYPRGICSPIFSMCSNVQIVDIEYPQGICSPIFVAEDFSELLAYPSVFLIKDLFFNFFN